MISGRSVESERREIPRNVLSAQEDDVAARVRSSLTRIHSTVDSTEFIGPNRDRDVSHWIEG